MGIIVCILQYSKNLSRAKLVIPKIKYLVNRREHTLVPLALCRVSETISCDSEVANETMILEITTMYWVWFLLFVPPASCLHVKSASASSGSCSFHHTHRLIE